MSTNRLHHLILPLICLFVQIGFLYKAKAAVEIAFSKIVALPVADTNSKTIDLSIYIDSLAGWSEKQIIQRLQKMNQKFASCHWQVSNVYVYQLKLSEPAVRMDDQINDVQYYDGFRAIAKKSQRVTPIQFFYIQKYQDPTAQQGGRPYVIHAENNIPASLYNSIWFPQGVDASAESREMENLLTKNSRDYQVSSTITAQRCSEFDFPRKIEKQTACGNLEESLHPLFATYFQKFGQNYYMTLYCVRNSQNLYKKLVQLKPEFMGQVYNVLMIHKDADKSLIPLMARGSAKGWSNHSVLMIDGLVLDLDYSSEPKMVPVSEYLENMWGAGKSDVQFLWRSAEDIAGYTNREVREAFASKKYPVDTIEGFSQFFSEQNCYQ